MKKAMFIPILVTALVIGWSCAVHAATLEDAKAMVAKVVQFYKANGKDKTLAEVNKGPKGQFYVQKDNVYPFIKDMNGVLLANGGDQKIVGINNIGTKDGTGKYFVKEQIEMAKTKGSGVFEYSWTHPVTKKIAPKIGYLQKVDDIIIACGVFK